MTSLLKCPLGAIVKSLVFENLPSGEVLLVLVSGQNRADLQVLSTLLGTAVEPAKPAAVLAKTGYPVGAVPPLGLPGVFQTIIDEDLFTFQQVWASAGAFNILMGVNPSDLSSLIRGQVSDIKQRSSTVLND